VSITLVFNEHIKVVAGEQVVIVGAGQWYELWRQDDWSGGEINNGNS
jgi:DNA-binding transcriptional regulator/RsmH inhibitor MraZ